MSSHAAALAADALTVGALGGKTGTLSRVRSTASESKNLRVESGAVGTAPSRAAGGMTGSGEYFGPTLQPASVVTPDHASTAIARRIRRPPAPARHPAWRDAFGAPRVGGSPGRTSGMKKIPIVVAKSIPANTPVPIE
jgi:hypothetical protein